MYKVSVITINLNNASGLEKTITSVINQTTAEFEYIIIDGGSADGSLDIVKEYENKITYWQIEPDQGIYNAMNKGIKKATGEYCIFLNSGDIFFDNQVIKSFTESGFYEDIIYGNCAFTSKTGLQVQKFPSSLTFYWLFTEYLSHPSTFMRRQLFENIGYYNEDLKIVSDWEFFLLAVGRHNSSTCYTDNIISVVEKGGISSSDHYRAQVKSERLQVMKKHFPYFYPDYSALYDLRHNSFIKKAKRAIKKLILWKRTG